MLSTPCARLCLTSRMRATDRSGGAASAGEARTGGADATGIGADDRYLSTQASTCSAVAAILHLPWRRYDSWRMSQDFGTHTASTQIPPSAQTTPHAPQFDGFCVSSVQIPSGPHGV